MLTNEAFWGAFLLLSGGLTLIVHGLRYRRPTADPHCPNCEYNLAAIESDRCPECGTLSDVENRPRSVRRRHIGVISVGAVLLLGGFGVAIPALVKVDWYTYQPTKWLLDDLRTGNAQQFDRAWTPIAARDDAGNLSDSTLRKLIAVALAEQAQQTTPLASEQLIHFLADCHADDRLLLDEARRFCENIFELTLEVRPHARKGDHIPFRFAHRGRGPQGALVPTLYKANVVIDEYAVGHERYSTQVTIRPNCLRNELAYLTSELAPLPEGNHVIRFRGNAVVMHRGKVVHEWPVALTGECTVGGPASTISPYVDDALADYLRKHVVIELATIRNVGHSIKFPRISKPVAFDIVLDYGATRRTLGSFAARSNGVPHRWLIPREWEPTPGALSTIIVRPNADAAAQTVDVFRYLDCELVFDCAAIKLEQEEELQTRLIRLLNRTKPTP